ncbi:MAG: glycosyltransferase [Bdellovibrionales bacterium]|nr:glycosyltransferase [Bdellovibrionales bacterium]
MSKLQKFYSLNPRFYLKSFRENQNLNEIDFKHKLKKALSGWHDTLLFDSSFLDNKNFEKYLLLTKQANLQAVLQICKALLDSYKKQLDFFFRKYPFLELHVIYEEGSFNKETLLKFKNRMSLVYVVTKKNRYHFSKSKDFNFKNTYLYFPYKKRRLDSFLTPRQVYQFIKKEKDFLVYPVDIYDDRLPEDLDLEPLFSPFFETQFSKKQVDFSIVIPCYNSKKQMVNTLKCLSQQDFPKNKYEIIVVDDGSLDSIREELQLFSQQHLDLNLKGIYYPRVIEKEKVKASFRAGLARNLGVKNSQGSFLCFLDSDILVPPDYLKKLKKEHEKGADGVLVKRYHLSSHARVENLFDKKENKDSYIEDESYWGSFYQKGFDQVAYPWKYVCTYGLSLSKKNFEELGGFGKNFLFYGFEDIDLGYRLFKSRKKVILSSIKVYHQAPTDKTRQNLLYPFFRQKQLAKTAKIFFYRHLDPEIYEALKVYMR